MRKWRKLGAAVGIAAMIAAGTGLANAGPGIEGNPYQRGPAPTTASIEAPTGAFAVAATPVPGGNGFGGGTLTYPTDTSQGTFGAVVVTPGFLSPEMKWYGPRLASQGFVVLTIATNTAVDQPGARAAQMLAALKYLVEQSPAKDRIDGSRLAVMGHSMGGGGSLEAAEMHPALKAAIPLEPWDLGKNFSAVRTPTLIVGGQNDWIAPVGQHAVPFYNSIPAGVNKAYIELAGGSHFVPMSPNVTIAKYSIAWLKRFVDNDTRYDQFLCPVPQAAAISVSKGTCPHT
ncbi:Platelet-activating factor acetylhydrolase, isoform II [Actinokineospora alba]|uniref:Platelet-activating factor acetylhydrolase, isoform II n=1 Tax=Actinokineospora alba TaxID=504798 RepID=A0A1H0LRQ5_9PSEU|nr:alpha/beta hydrolase [Actinokineospora alba]TDP67425.1 platelet-activating factor acetylhydrolase isoform II [Actinokineospora alba]SDI97094.1 Platelet-activating factor acetylhydrolase, isoform II [Actinokineospora alba]SDO70775.1 Platelet-activating factor acetylhydrolase, isoform II [Actinokineospora alba]